MSCLAVVLGCLVAVACGGCGGGDGAGDDAGADESDAGGGDAGGTDASPGDPWLPLVSVSWTVAPLSEAWRCNAIAVEQDTWITGFRPISPDGTWRQLLTVSDAWDGETGEFDCAPANVAPGGLYASGIGTDDLTMPDGVAMHVAPGQTLVLNTQLRNETLVEISGESGVQIQTTAMDQVVHEANMVFAGRLNFTVAGDGAPHDVAGGCGVAPQSNVFAMWPHMHRFGVHQKVLRRLGGAVLATPHDADYDLLAQTIHDVDVVFDVNDQLLVLCTYVNDTGVVVSAGDDVDEEQCFTAIYRYPASGNLYSCTAP